MHPCSPHLGLCRASGNLGPPPNALSSPRLSPEHQTLKSSCHLSTGYPQASCLTPKPGHKSQGMDGPLPILGLKLGTSVSYSPTEPSVNLSPPKPAHFSRAGHCHLPRPPASWVFPGPCLSRLSSHPSRPGDTGRQGSSGGLADWAATEGPSLGSDPPGGTQPPQQHAPGGVSEQRGTACVTPEASGFSGPAVSPP